MSQVNLITLAHYQTFNAHHLPSHKWAEDKPSAADQVKSAADKKNHYLDLKLIVWSNPAPLFLG